LYCHGGGGGGGGGAGGYILFFAVIKLNFGKLQLNIHKINCVQQNIFALFTSCTFVYCEEK
jgi:hypothetical protein